MTPTKVDVLPSAEINTKVIPEEKQKIMEEIKRLEKELLEVKGTTCEVWSRCVGYFRPTSQWNPGKQEEFAERKVFNINTKG